MVLLFHVPRNDSRPNPPYKLSYEIVWPCIGGETPRTHAAPEDDDGDSGGVDLGAFPFAYAASRSRHLLISGFACRLGKSGNRKQKEKIIALDVKMRPPPLNPRRGGKLRPANRRAPV